MSLEERARGPVAVARMLADEAGLNRDQLGFVAIVAVALQGAWNTLPTTANGMLRKDKVLLRCLLVGGGGCGKTRVINKVLRPLFQAFFGEDAVQTQAPSMNLRYLQMSWQDLMRKHSRRRWTDYWKWEFSRKPRKVS